MSMGSDFSSGYGLGLDTKRVNQAPSFNPWPYLAQAGGGVTPSFRGRVYSRGGGGVPAKQILENARLEALKRKETELNIAAKEIENRAAEQKMNQDRLKFMGDRTKAAEDRAQGLKTERYAADDRANVNSADQAIRGFYTKDKEPILNFINQNGSPEANAVNVNWGDGSELDDAGKVYIKFSDGRTVAYANDKDAIEKVIAPMAILQQDIKGRMTENQAANIEVEKQKGLNTSSKEWGKQNQKERVPESEKAKLRAKFITDYQKNNDGAFPDDTIVKEFEKITFGETKVMNRAGNQRTPSEAGYQGLNTSGAPSTEKQIADKAIADGRDPALVKKRYKERTGKDYDSK